MQGARLSQAAPPLLFAGCVSRVAQAVRDGHECSRHGCRGQEAYRSSHFPHRRPRDEEPLRTHFILSQSQRDKHFYFWLDIFIFRRTNIYFGQFF